VLQRCKDLTMTRRKTLPTPAASDPVLERAMLDAAKSAGWNPRALVITSDWAIDRHPRSGIVVGRSRVAAIAFSHTDGTCRYSLVDFYEEFVAGEFSGPKLGPRVGATVVLDCAALPALPAK
jgi:hypothetical protein